MVLYLSFIGYGNIFLDDATNYILTIIKPIYYLVHDLFLLCCTLYSLWHYLLLLFLLFVLSLVEEIKYLYITVSYNI